MSTQDEAEEIERARAVKNFALKNEGLIDEDQNTIDRKDALIAELAEALSDHGYTSDLPLVRRAKSEIGQ